MMGKNFEITAVKARQIFDCLGYPTVQVDVWVNNTILGRADVPSPGIPKEDTKLLTSAMEEKDMLALV